MRVLTILSLTLLGMALGCASSPNVPDAADNFAASDVSVPRAGELVVLLPSRGEDKDIARGEAILLQQLAQAFEKLGYRVATLSAQNYSVIWRQEVEAVGGVFASESGELKSSAHAVAISRLVQRICGEVKCSLVVRHRLVTRNAELRGIVARWDGQERRVPLSSTAGGSWDFSGQTKALSVELLGVSKGGELAFRTYGGASLPFAADVVRARAVLREDLFEEPTEISEGVRIALRAFFSQKK